MAVTATSPDTSFQTNWNWSWLAQIVAPAPVIRYCLWEASKSVDPFLEGPPTSPERVKTPRGPSSEKAEAASRQESRIPRTAGIVASLRLVVCWP